MGGYKSLRREVRPPMEQWYLDDIPLNEPWESPEYLVTEEELVAFARKWDPLPMHTDREAARESPHGGLIAPALYVLGIASSAANPIRQRAVFIGGGEWKARFLRPVRPGDRLVCTTECVGKRASRTKPDRGIVRIMVTMENQRRERTLEYEAAVMVARREHA